MHHHHHHTEPHRRPININVGFNPPIAQPAIHTTHHFYPTAPAPSVPVAVPPVTHIGVPTPVEPSSSDSYTWMPTSSHACRSLETKGVVVGYEGHDRSPIYVGRAHYGGDIIPCKVIPRHNVAYIPYNMQEIRVEQFEMFCRTTTIIEWIPGSHGSIPAGAVAAGRTASGETLYVGRAHHQGSLTPGKVHPSHQSCYISFSGTEVACKNYEVMVQRTL